MRLDYVTTFTSKTAFPKFLFLMPFISFSMNSPMNVIMANVRDTWSKNC